MHSWQKNVVVSIATFASKARIEDSTHETGFDRPKIEARVSGDRKSQTNVSH
jgi:hypothetical protein